MGCPWDGLSPANLHFCEASVCGWITQPANTWSNAGFLLVGAWVIVHAARRGHRTAGLLGWIAIATGLASAALHATSTLVGQLIDQGAMFLESAFFITVNLRRWRAWEGRRLLATYLALVGASVGLLAAFPTLGIALFAAHVAIFLGIEARLYFRDGRTTRYRALAVVGVLFAVSWGVWWLD